jgi:hypothetical protein
MCFGRVVLKLAFGDLVTTFATEEAKVVVHLMLVFLLGQLATRVQLAGQVILQSRSRGLLLLSRVLLLLAFVGFLVVLLARVVVRVTGAGIVVRRI